ncbi:MAG: serine/threonine protein kinase [Phycisphaeraceae bacterium]|nr:serine/threonine protein kinase [Phycisphaeraceae bacterium]
MDQGDQSQIHTGDLSPAARAAAEAAASMAPGPGEQSGDQIGPYKLLEVLGEGGFGTVWLAERREPMVQRVALKIIKPGMDSRAVIARFEQERQALALMDHPCIAKVLDAGATPAGRPYFVMEHVKGAPITDYCDRQRLTIRQRLELFIKVCDAVQHAHTKGIIHRDLKPSNILVAVGDAREPRPVVIDFGVAKAIASRLTEKTVFTQHGQIIGTPEYMSPEQAEMSETSIDTRTDIYALGVVLYELLTGALPFDTRTLRSAGYAAIQKMIREVDPPRPSTRLTSLGDASTRAADARHARLSDLVTELRGELEWIPLKALRKDRVERYRNASELADDIGNYLNNRPLIAGPESATYKARKFVRRNRAGVFAAGLVLAALLLGVVGTSIGMVRARAAERTARAAEAAERDAKAAAVRSEEEARARAAEAEAVNRFLVTTLQSPSPMERGPNVTVAHVLKEGAPHIAREFAQQPLTQLALHRTYANVLRTLNIYDGAAEHARKALDLARAHRADDKALIAELLMLLGNAQKEFGAYDQTAAALFEARDIIESLSPADPRRTMAIHNGLGALSHNLGDYDGAERHYRIAMGATARDTIDDAINQDRLARLLVDTGRLDEAEPMIRNALAIRERISGAESTGAAFGRLTLGYLLLARGRADEAAAQYRAARDIYARLHQTDRAPMARLAAMDLRGVFEDAAGGEGGAPVAGDGDDATAQAEQVNLGGLERTPVMSLRNRARILYRLDPSRAAQADALFERAIAIDRRVGGPVQPASEAHTRAIWGQSLLDAGLADRAEEQFRLAADLQRRSLSGESKGMMAQTLLGYAGVLVARGRAAESLPLIEEAAGLRAAAAGSEAWTVGLCDLCRARALAALDRQDEARSSLERGRVRLSAEPAALAGHAEALRHTAARIESP